MPNLLRLTARVLTGSTYVALGVDTVRTPEGRVDHAAPVLAAVRRHVPLPTDDALMVRANGAAQVFAGAFADGRRGAEVVRVGTARVAGPNHDRRPRILDRRRSGGPRAATGPIPQEHGHDRRTALRSTRPGNRCAAGLGLERRFVGRRQAQDRAGNRWRSADLRLERT